MQLILAYMPGSTTLWTLASQHLSLFHMSILCIFFMPLCGAGISRQCLRLMILHAVNFRSDFLPLEFGTDTFAAFYPKVRQTYPMPLGKTVSGSGVRFFWNPAHMRNGFR